jgi:CBS domain-containing protein
MKKTQVRDVMTCRVVAVMENTPFKEIVRAMRHYHVNALPVVDSDCHVRGIVSSTDLVIKEAKGSSSRLAAIMHRKEHTKSCAGRAVELMTTPARTVDPSLTVTKAAETMRRHQINQLPVVEPKTDILIGIVTRSDLLRVYERDDVEILAEIMAECDSRPLNVEVRRGVVVLSGQAKDHTAVTALIDEIKDIEGVVHIIDKCTQEP